MRELIQLALVWIIVWVGVTVIENGVLDKWVENFLK